MSISALPNFTFSALGPYQPTRKPDDGPPPPPSGESVTSKKVEYKLDSSGNPIVEKPALPAGATEAFSKIRSGFEGYEATWKAGAKHPTLKWIKPPPKSGSPTDLTV